MDMTATVTENARGRHYEVRQPGFPDVIVPSVTNIIDPLASTGLVPWSGWLAAREAIRVLPSLVAAMLRKECGRTYHKHAHTFDEHCTPDCACGKCSPCWQRRLSNMHLTESSRRAKEGGIVHNWIEDWILSDGKVRRGIAPELKPYIDAFDTFINDYGLTAESFVVCEAVAFNREAGYAGTTDGMVLLKASDSYKSAVLVAAILNHERAEGDRLTAKDAAQAGLSALVLLDWKTRENEGAEFYESHPLQLAPYRFAPLLMIKGTTTFVETPKTDGAIIVQLRPDGYTARPMVADETTYQAFLAQLKVHTWVGEHGSRAIGAHTFKAKALRSRAKPTKVVNTVAAPILAADPVAPAVLAAPRVPAPRRAPVAAQDRKPATPGGAVVTGQRATMNSMRQPAPVGASPYADEIPF